MRSSQREKSLITLRLVIKSTQPRPDGTVWVCECLNLRLRSTGDAVNSALMVQTNHLKTREVINQELPAVPSADLSAAQSTSDSTNSYNAILVRCVLNHQGGSRREEVCHSFGSESQRILGNDWRVTASEFVETPPSSRPKRRTTTRRH